MRFCGDALVVVVAPAAALVDVDVGAPDVVVLAAVVVVVGAVLGLFDPHAASTSAPAEATASMSPIRARGVGAFMDAG
jgi:hypothetical protein